MSQEAVLIDYRDALDPGASAGDPTRALAEELVSFRAPTSVEAEQYRTLRNAVERLRRDAGLQVFAVTSPEPGDGKSVTTLNLAGALAQAPEARVLVICADFHRAAMAGYLGLDHDRSAGLADAIVNDDLGVAQVARRLDALNMSVLLAGRVRTQPYELLVSPRLEKLFAEARGLYDYVLVDTPPVVPLADCRLLARSVDGFLVVVAARKTPRKLLGEALSQLAPARVLGLVFNGDDRPLAPYYGYYGSQQPSRLARKG